MDLFHMQNSECLQPAQRLIQLVEEVTFLVLWDLFMFIFAYIS